MRVASMRLVQCIAQPARSFSRRSFFKAFENPVHASAVAAREAAQAPKSNWVKAGWGFAAAGLAMAAAPLTVAGCTGPAVTEDDVTVNGTGSGTNLKALDKKKIVFVLGGPGSGKGTQCAKLVEEFGLIHLSAGDLLRAHMKSGTPDGNMVAEMIQHGQIVPSRVTISLLEDAMEKSGKDKFLIDGFPRNEENRGAFHDQTGRGPDFVLFFDCPEEVMEKRLLGRNEGRTDDNIETIRKRFKVFIDSSLPVINFYEKLGVVYKVKADRAADDVYTDVRKLFLDSIV